MRFYPAGEDVSPSIHLGRNGRFAVIYRSRQQNVCNNGPNPTPAFRTLTVYAVFNVALIAGNQTQGGGPLSLIYELAYIDYGVLALFLSDKQQADIQQEVNRLKLPSTTLDLSPLSAMLRRPVAAINAGIVCDEDGSFVVLRADIEVYKTPIAVTSHFFLDPPENLLQVQRVGNSSTPESARRRLEHNGQVDLGAPTMSAMPAAASRCKSAGSMMAKFLSA